MPRSLRNSPGLPPLVVAVLTVCSCVDPGPPTGASSQSLVFTGADVHVWATSDRLATVRDLEVLADGSVWVLNSDEPLFLGFDPMGSLLAVHGTRGGGPEEFGQVAGFVSDRATDQAWVLDTRRHALIEVSNPGGPRSEEPLPADLIPRGSLVGGFSLTNPTVRTSAFGPEVILPRTGAPRGTGLTALRLAILGADLVAFDPRTDSVDVVVSLARTLDDPEPTFEPTEGGFPLWFRLWSTCGKDTIRVYDRVRNEVRGFTHEGHEVATVSLPPVSLTEVTPTQLAMAVFELRAAEVTGGVGGVLSEADSTRLMQSMIQEAKGSPQQLATYLPRYVDLRCGDDGTLWIQPLDPDLGGLKGSRTWLALLPDGYTRQVTLPERFDPLRFRQGRIWGVQRDDLDVASVAYLELPLEALDPP